MIWSTKKTLQKSEIKFFVKKDVTTESKAWIACARKITATINHFCSCKSQMASKIGLGDSNKKIRLCNIRLNCKTWHCSK